MDAERIDRIGRQIKAGEYETPERLAGTADKMLEPPVAYVTGELHWDLPDQCQLRYTATDIG